VNLVEKVLPKF